MKYMYIIRCFSNESEALCLLVYVAFNKEKTKIAKYIELKIITESYTIILSNNYIV